MLWVAHRVGHLVTVGAQDPGRHTVTLACLVCRDWLQTGLIRVRFEHFINRLLAIFNFLTKSVARPIVLENVLGVMHPIFLLAHLLGGGSGNRLLWILRLVRLNIKGLLALLLTLGDLVATKGHKLRGVVDSGDLGAQVVLLLAEVERIGDDFAFQVTCEADLDLLGSLQVRGVQIWEAHPRALGLIGDEVGVLVHARTASLPTLGSRVLGQVLGLKGLSNVIVHLSSLDAAPEPNRPSVSLDRKLLQTLLQDESTIVTELKACLIKNVTVEGC